MRLSLKAVAAALCLAFGAAVAWGAAQLPMGSVRLPGPGAFPLAIGIGLMVLAALMLRRGPRAPANTSDDPPEPFGHARVALVCALVAAFVLVLPAIGFLAASALLMIAFHVIGADGRLGWRPLVAGAVTAGAAYALFAVLLDVPLPRGWLWGL